MPSCASLGKAGRAGTRFILPALEKARLVLAMGIGWSIHRNDGWLGHLKRLRRWHDRVREAARIGHPDLEDFIFVFFQCCYQMREWMLQTATIPPDEVNRFYADTKALRLCRDICNGTKHLNIADASVDPGFSIGWEYNHWEPNNARLFLIADDKYDLLDLAAQCMSLTDEFATKDRTKPTNGPGTIYRNVRNPKRKPA
jgi:hypothetical protein